MQQGKSLFTTYEFSPSEAIQASILPLLNQAFIQNKIAELATVKVNLTYDPEHPLKFQQEEAELQGQIKILQYLIDESTVSQKLVADITTENPNS